MDENWAMTCSALSGLELFALAARKRLIILHGEKRRANRLCKGLRINAAPFSLAFAFWVLSTATRYIGRYRCA